MNQSPNQSTRKTVVTAASSRRDFVKRTVALGAAFAVPSVVTRPVFGAAAPSNRVNVGQIGCGGISSADDAIEFIMAGASAVQVGTATFRDARSMTGIIDGVGAFLRRHDIRDLACIRGIVR